MVELKRTKRVYAMKVSGSNPVAISTFCCLIMLEG